MLPSNGNSTFSQMDSRRCCGTNSYSVHFFLAAGFLALRRWQRRRRLLRVETSFQEKAQLHGDDIKPKEVPANAVLEMESSAVPVEMDAGYAGGELNAETTRVE